MDEKTRFGVAARRLIIVLVVLFAVSIAAAAIAPERRQLGGEDSSTTTTTQPEEESTDGPEGAIVEARIEASAAKPETVRVGVGDQLVLDVASGTTRQVAIEPLGLLGPAAEGAPARFDLLLREPGALPVTDALTDRVIGRVLVTEDAARPSAGKGPGDPHPPDRPPEDAGVAA